MLQLVLNVLSLFLSVLALMAGNTAGTATSCSDRIRVLCAGVCLLVQEFQDWEALSRSAPNGKWRGANSRKWGKVGIEMRLTGNVPCTPGPVTELGKMVCKFVDIVDEVPPGSAQAAAFAASAAAAAPGAATSPVKGPASSDATALSTSGSAEGVRRCVNTHLTCTPCFLWFWMKLYMSTAEGAFNSLA